MDYKPYFKCTPHRQPTADSEKAYGRLHLKWVTAVECFFALQRCLPPHFRKRSSPCLEQFQQENPLNACLCHFLLKINMCVCVCLCFPHLRLYASRPWVCVREARAGGRALALFCHVLHLLQFLLTALLRVQQGHLIKLLNI